MILIPFRTYLWKVRILFLWIVNIMISAIFPTNPKHATEKSNTPSNQKSRLVTWSSNDSWTSSKVMLEERITIWSICITSEKLALFFKRTIVLMWQKEDREQGTRDNCTRPGSWEKLRGKRFCSFILQNNIPHHIINKSNTDLQSRPTNQSEPVLHFTRCEVKVLCVDSGGQNCKT